MVAVSESVETREMSVKMRQRCVPLYDASQLIRVEEEIEGLFCGAHFVGVGGIETREIWREVGVSAVKEQALDNVQKKRGAPEERVKVLEIRLKV